MVAKVECEEIETAAAQFPSVTGRTPAIGAQFVTEQHDALASARGGRQIGSADRQSIGCRELAFFSTRDPWKRARLQPRGFTQHSHDERHVPDPGDDANQGKDRRDRAGYAKEDQHFISRVDWLCVPKTLTPS